MLVPSTPEPAVCLYSLQAPTELPPGVWNVGPDPERVAYVLFDFVSDDGRLLQRMSISAAGLDAKRGYFKWWREKMNEDRLAHRCPECPARPVASRGRDEIPRLA